MIVIWEDNEQLKQKIKFALRNYGYNMEGELVESGFLPDIDSIITLENKVNDKFKGNYCFFPRKTSIITPDLLSINMEHITNISKLFKKCTELQCIILTHFDTKNVVDMSYMFCRCIRLSKIIWKDQNSLFDTRNVTNMSGMFKKCGLIYIDLNGLDTRSVTNMSDMFYKCLLYKINVSCLDTRNVTNMSGMFYGCENAEIQISEKEYNGSTAFNTSNVTNMSRMFSRVTKTKYLDLSHLNTSNVTDMSRMFAFNAAIYINVSMFDTSKVQKMNDMFYNCNLVEHLDVSYWNTSNVTDMNRMFDGCGITYIDISYWNTSNVTDMNRMFDESRRLYEISLTHITDDDCLTGIDIRNVTNMNCMFSNTIIQYLDLSTFDTRNVTSMNCMFRYCYCLIELDLCNFDENSNKQTSNDELYELYKTKGYVGPYYIMENGERKFYGEGMPLLVPSDFKGFTTKNVTSMMDMFYNCERLKRLNISFDTRRVSNMTNMFRGCKSLTHLDVSSFTIMPRCRMWGMFTDVNLNFINIYSWNINNVKKSSMRETNIKYIYSAYMKSNKNKSIQNYIYDPIYGMYKRF